MAPARSRRCSRAPEALNVECAPEDVETDQPPQYLRDPSSELVGVGFRFWMWPVRSRKHEAGSHCAHAASPAGLSSPCRDRCAAASELAAECQAWGELGSPGTDCGGGAGALSAGSGREVVVVRSLPALARLYNAPSERRVAAATRPLKGPTESTPARLSLRGSGHIVCARPFSDVTLPLGLGASLSSEPGATLENAAGDSVGGEGTGKKSCRPMADARRAREGVGSSPVTGQIAIDGRSPGSRCRRSSPRRDTYLA
jgi:hypothetical protein